MSAYKKITTEFRNKDSLLAALKEMGITPQVARDAKVPSLPMEGYHGDMRPERASINIPRAQVNKWSGGASNDLGFAWDGRTFAAIVSDFDSRASKSLMDQLTQKYALIEIKRKAKINGYTVRELQQPDGSIRVQLTHY